MAELPPAPRGEPVRALKRLWSVRPDLTFAKLIALVEDEVERRAGMAMYGASDDVWLAAIEALIWRATSPYQNDDEEVRR